MPDPYVASTMSTVLDPESVEPVDPFLQLGAAGAAERDMVQAGPELRELPIFDFPVVLMDAEQRAVVECPDQMPESCVGVLVEHRIGTDQLLGTRVR